MPADLIPVVQRSYDLCAGLYAHVNRFPRAQRTLLGRVILEDALRMMVLLVRIARERIPGAWSLALLGREGSRETVRTSAQGVALGYWLAAPLGLFLASCGSAGTGLQSQI